MRFLQLVIAKRSSPPTPPTAEHMAKVGKAIKEAIASGAVLATGGLGKRATAAARVTRKGSEVSVEDPPSGDGWMASDGYSLTQFASKEDAIANARRTLEIMGSDAAIELIQVSEMHPPANRPAISDASDASRALPRGVVPYLTIDGASEASAFYEKAFAATEIARVPGDDGKRLMHRHLEINGGALMLADHCPEMGLSPVQRSSSYNSSNHVMQLVVADGDRWWTRAIEAGCTEKLPFARAPWGDKYGQLTDPFGVTWAISSPSAG